jgi:Domain of unknown function (DUF4397)
MLTKKNRVWAIVALLTGVIGFSSCLKNNNDVTPQRPMAKIVIHNASLSALTVPSFLFDNDQIVANDTITFNFIASYSVYGGPHKFDLRKKAGDSTIATTGNVALDSTAYYTYLTWGTNPALSAFIKTDVSNFNQSKIGLRFLNLSPDAGPVDFYIGNEKVDSNRVTFSQSQLGNASSFTLFGNFSINNQITVKQAGTPTVIANITLPLIPNRGVTSLVPGAFYTVYLAGLRNGTGASKAVVNAYYNVGVSY